jgi:hypothetical protein
MAKKPSTVNLEEAIWTEIEAFMEEHKVNRNTAIEWMIIERKVLLNKASQVVVQQQVSPVSVPEQVQVIESEVNELDNGVIGKDELDSIYNDMED